jgi:hypothetical protein
MANVRVFLPTYQRPRLLERAVASLRAQTCGDWTCEVHNDDPQDDGPRQLLTRVGDARFSLVQHERNLGATATFNLFFRATPEPFYAMLEDDNAWEPEFLATMMATAAQHPDVTVFWSNQSLWQEEPDGTMRDLKRSVHPLMPDATPRRIAWGQPAQITGAMHANGSALFRSRPGDDFSTPLVPFAPIEAFRERRFPYPIVFVPQPLARFSLTRRTARSNDHREWAEIQMMLAATFLAHVRLGSPEVANLFTTARARQPSGASTLLLVGLMDARCRPLLGHATAAEWLRLLLGFVRRPGLLLHLLRSRRTHGEWWEFLERHTAARFAAA